MEIFKPINFSIKFNLFYIVLFASLRKLNHPLGLEVGKIT